MGFKFVIISGIVRDKPKRYFNLSFSLKAESEIKAFREKEWKVKKAYKNNLFSFAPKTSVLFWKSVQLVKINREWKKFKHKSPPTEMHQEHFYININKKEIEDKKKLSSRGIFNFISSPKLIFEYFDNKN